MLENNMLPEVFKKNLRKHIDDAVSKIELSPTERKYYRKFYKFASLFLLICGVPILVITILSKTLNWPLFVMIIGIILSVIFLSSSLFIYFLWAKSWKKVFHNFQKYHVLSGFYGEYIESVNENIKINRLTNKIEGLPEFDKNIYHAVYCRDTFVGEFHKLPFQIGTVIYEKVYNNSINPRTEQNRRSYYQNLYLIISTKSTNVTMKITRDDDDLLHKLIKKKNDEVAYKFTDFLSLKPENKALKTLLSDEVIKNLKHLVEKNKNNLPTIIINDTEFIFEWDLGLTHNSKSHFFASIEYVKSLNDIKIAILNNVYQDTEVIVNCLKWIDAFKVID